MPRFSIVLHSSGADMFHEAVVFAAGASAQGKDVLLFLRGPALASYVNRLWPEPAEKPLRRALESWGDPEETLREIRSRGKVRVYACSAWVRMLGLDPGQTAARVDAVIGLNGFMSQAEGGQILYL